MKKVRGKALALVLSLALVVSSFSTAFTSAASRTLKGTLSLEGGDDEFYFVNGDENKDNEFLLGDAIGTPELKAPNGEDVSDEYISDISHKSGDHLVKWFDTSSDDEDSIDEDTDYDDVAVKLRNTSSSGEETLSVLYSGTYTDDDDNEYTVKASKDVTIRVYDEHEVVLGESGADNHEDGSKGEYDDNFAQKTTKKVQDGDKWYYAGESKNLVALKAERVPGSLEVHWDELSTAPYEGNKDLTDKVKDQENDPDYLLDSSSDNLEVTADGTTYGPLTDETKTPVGGTTTYTAAQVADPDADAVTVAPVTKATALGTDTKLATTDSGTDHNEWTYKYTIDEGEPQDLALTTGVPIGDLAAGEHTVKIESFAPSATTASASTTVTVTVTTTGGTVDASKYATLAKTADNEITVTPSQADTDDPANAWTYKYSINNGDVKTLDAGSLKFTVPFAAGTDNIKVTATDASKNTYTTTAKITVSAPTESDDVVVSVKKKAGASSLTLTLKATKALENRDDANDDYVADTDDVDLKTKIEKKILVQDAAYKNLGKDGTTTWLYTNSLDDASEDDGNAIKANGFEVNFDIDGGVSVNVDDDAKVSKISGKVTTVTVDGDSTVDEISPDGIDNLPNNGIETVSVSEGKVGTIDFDDNDDDDDESENTYAGKVTVDSDESVVGDITDAKIVDISNGTVGNIDAEDSVDIKADDDDHSVTVGDVSTKELTIDSEDSSIKTGTLTASDDDAEFTLTGSAVTVGGIDFDHYNTELKLDDFQGSIPAPANADDDDATLSTNDADDRVTVKGDADISDISLEEDSQITFDGALNVGNVDGTGKLVIAPAKLYVSSDASSDVQLVLSGSFKAGDVAYTAAHDSIDEDSFDNYGFTVTKTEGSDKDTFKIKSLEFTGLTITPATADIAKGYSQTFTASAYAPGSAIPEGYTIEFAFDGNDEYFTAVDNQDGTATVTVKDLDPTFASENQATLTAYLVDADGATNDDYDEGEADIKAVAVPATNFKSDTTGNVPLKVGQTYQFKITSLDGKAPTFGVAGNGATVQYAGATGSDYFYKVTGAKEGSYGVYVNGGGVEHRAAILVIKGVNVTTDTTAVTKAPGQTYQFKITAPSQPNFVAVGLKSVLASKSGNNYFYKVTASNVKGGHGIYVNGVRVAIFTVA